MNGICGIHATDLYRFVCEFLENSSQLRRLILKDTSIFDDNDIDVDISRFCYAIEKSKCLEELTMAEDLVYTAVNDGYNYDESHLQQILDYCGRLRYLSFRGDDGESNLGEDWCERVSSFLEHNTNLTSLVLEGRFLGDNEAELLASALEHNTSLRSLDLGVCLGYGISAEGVKELRKVLCGVDSFTVRHGVSLSGLNAIASNCNHTCSIQLTNENRGISKYEEICPNEDLLKLINRYECPKDNRRLKILSALYASNCKGPHKEMEDMHLACIPNVLAMVSQEEYGNKVYEDDTSSVVSMISIVSYDSELDELEEAFDEWVDDVFVDFHKSFTDSRFTGKQARLTMFYHILRTNGVCLMEYSSSIPHSIAIPGKKKKANRGRKRAHS